MAPPKTWDDYIAIAKAFQGKDLDGDGKPDYGSCIAKKRSAQSYWMVLSVAGGFLQSKGTGQGLFFDTETMPHLVTELERHRAALGPETVAMMQRHEAEGTLKHPEYDAAITILNYRHVIRLAELPKPVDYSLKRWNMDVYGVMQGPNEFLYTGNLKDWNRIPEMHEITVPTLIVCGQHDEITPACSMRMLNALPNAEIAVFPNSSHMAMYEEPEAYFARLTKFLGKQRGKKK